MKRINLLRYLLFVVSGCCAAVLLVSSPAESQNKKAPPVILESPAGQAQTRSKVFDLPTIHYTEANWSNSSQDWTAADEFTTRLDWCREFGLNCGKPAADAFCHSQGYGAASKFVGAANVGQTVTFSEHKYCLGAFCAGFQTIECVGTATIFESPWTNSKNGNTVLFDARVDWCLEWESQCGKPAADWYCKFHGFPRGALRFEMAPHVALKTVTGVGGSDQRVCDGTKRNCDSFKVIECDAAIIPR